MVLLPSWPMMRLDRKLFCAFFVVFLLTLMPACNDGGGKNQGSASQGNSQIGGNDVTDTIGSGPGAEIVAPDQQLYNNAEAWYSQKQYDQAELALDRIVREYASGTVIDDAHYLKGKIAYRRDEFIGAIGEFEIVIAQYPNSDLVDNAVYWIGKSEHAQGHYDAARIQYQRVLSDYPNGSYLESSRYELAKTYFDEGGVTPPNVAMLNLAIDGFRDILINHATSIKADDAQYFLARSYHELNDFISARAEYQILWDNYPASTWRDNAQYQIGRTYYNQAAALAGATPPGTAAEINGNLTSAISAFELLLSSYPGSSSADTAQYYLGRSYQQMEPPDFMQAREHLTTLIVNYATSSFADNAQLQLGHSYYSEAIATPDATLFATALVELAKVISNYPGSSSMDDAQLYIGKCYHKRGIANLDTADIEQGRTEYQKLIDDYPDSTLRDNAALRIGETYHDAGNNDLGVNNCALEKIQMQLVIDNFPGTTSATNAQTHLDGANSMDANHGFCP